VLNVIKGKERQCKIVKKCETKIV